ncbi:MAG: hypothetical protein C7B44_06180 [Sulfobacillus thermosulfidooxidans]|nr:MAG: hypothetical protein C7B44_06180 [Sulfobacillus thermosulfidooxidans]
MTSDILEFTWDQDPGTVVEAIRQWVKQHDFVDYGVIDHRRDMKDRGVPDPPHAYTILFGNPVAGSRFIATQRSAVADMPIRIGVFGENGASTLVYHMMSSLLAQHDTRLTDMGKAVDQIVIGLCHDIGAIPIEGF